MKRVFFSEKSYKLPKFCGNKAAFSLAELLITISILGILIALVIPNLMAEYRKRVIEARIQKTFYVINQAVEIAAATYMEDFDIVAVRQRLSNSTADANGFSWELSSAVFDKFFKDLIKPRYTYTKKEKTYQTLYFQSGKTFLYGGNYSWYELSNGSRIGFCAAGNYDGFYFVIIPRPYLKKIYAGVDFYEIGFIRQDGIYRYWPYWYTYWLNGKITEEKLIEYCASETSYVAYASHPTSFCFFILYKNKFKIPDNYPLKY